MRHAKDLKAQESTGATQKGHSLAPLGRMTALALLGVGLICSFLFLVIWSDGHKVVAVLAK